MNCYASCSIPLSVRSSHNQRIAEAVSYVTDQLSTLDHFVLLGDFNLPNIRWIPSDNDSHCEASEVTASHEYIFIDNVAANCMQQISRILNKDSNQLDLVFTTDPSNARVEESLTSISKIDEYHPPLNIILTIEAIIHNKLNADSVSSNHFNFYKADFELLNNLLSSINFESILCSEDSIDVQIDKFYSVILDCVEQSVPHTTQRFSSSSPPWYSKELRKLRNCRNKLWRTYMKSGSTFDHSKYLNAYNNFVVLANELYREYIDKMQSNIIFNPKRFWQFINSKKQTDGYPNTLMYLDSFSNDSSTIANLFADYFSQSFSCRSFVPDGNYFSYLRNCAQTSLTSIDIDLEAVINKISNLNEDYSPGPDGLPAIVLKKCMNSLALPITILFQRSLACGVFPSLWKDSYIVPIFKKGCKSDIMNYRPIAKLSCIPKLLESLVYDTVYFHSKSLLSPEQHGFMRGKSTTTNLVEFASHTLVALESGLEVDAVVTDFSKAFDKISHKIIMFKLNALGFPPLVLRWIASYLNDRQYRVFFRSSTSNPFTATSGVPQGSHLGPILFNLATNDAVHVIKSSDIIMYADDMKIFYTISSPMDALLLQSDLNSFVVWCEMNHLFLNIEKCHSITYSRKRTCPLPRGYLINGAPISSVSSFRDLGVVLDNELNFIDHYNYIVNRANSSLGFIKRWSREFANPFVTKALYVTFVRPLLEYASQVWSPHQEIYTKRIESVQRRFTRFALRGMPSTDPYNLPPYTDRLKILNLQSLQRRREVADITFIHQILAGAIESSKILEKINFNFSPRVLRSVPLFRVPQHRTNYGNNEPLTRMLREVNENCDQFDYNCSKVTLKRLLYSNAL